MDNFFQPILSERLSETSRPAQIVATEHLKCGLFELRSAVYVKHMLDFKDLAQNFFLKNLKYFI